MQRLRGRHGVRFLEFRDYARRYLQHLPERSPEEVRRDYLAFKYYYFAFNPGTPFERALVQYLRKHKKPGKTREHQTENPTHKAKQSPVSHGAVQ